MILYPMHTCVEKKLCFMYLRERY